MLSGNLAWLIQGHSEVRYAILGNILHPQKFCPIISIEVSTKLSDIALTVSALVLEYSEVQCQRKMLFYILTHKYIVLAWWNFHRCESLKTRSEVFLMTTNSRFLEDIIFKVLCSHWHLNVFMVLTFPHFYFTPSPHPPDFIASSQVIYFVKVSIGRKEGIEVVVKW